MTNQLPVDAGSTPATYLSPPLAHRSGEVAG
jgi:hypothetical protein